MGCDYCNKRLGMVWFENHQENNKNGTLNQFCNKEHYLRHKYAIPKDAKEIDGAEGMLIGYSELAMHTGHAGHFISRLWCNSEETYGYAIIKDNLGFLHGSMYIHDQHNISLS